MKNYQFITLIITFISLAAFAILNENIIMSKILIAISIIIIFSFIFYRILFTDKVKNIKKERDNVITINYSKICAFLLLIIIILILNYHGFFYKFTIITRNNIDEILLSNNLSESEKMTISMKLFFSKEEIYGKFIFQVLN